MSTSCQEKTKWDVRRVDLHSRGQRTLRQKVSAKGVGLFTGQEVSLSLSPAPADHGILFQRMDCPGSPLIPASSEFVQITPRCTVLGIGQIQVQTVEHLLAALRACDLDNVLIQLDSKEVPIFDGSAEPFVSLIQKGGIQDMVEQKEVLVLKEPIYWSSGDVYLIALPCEEYKISYTLHYPHSSLIGSQFYSFSLTEEGFIREIAPSRTFSIYEEIAPMIEKGLIKGGSLESAVLIKGGEVANPGGLRFRDEMVRHKILDLIGDNSLLPRFNAHVVAICSGHAANHEFAKQFLKYVKGEC